MLDILKSNASKDEKQEAVFSFKEMLEFTSHYPSKFDMNINKKEYMMYSKEVPYLLEKYFDDLLNLNWIK